MGTTLTGTTPQDTYDSLIKVTDNGPLSATAKYLSDGLGNDSVLALSTAAVTIGTSTALAARLVTAQGRVAISNASGANDSQLALYADGTTNGIYSTYNSTGSYLPMAFYTSDVERMRITAAGNVGIGTSTPSAKLTISTGVAGVMASFTDAVAQTLSLLTGSGFSAINNPSGGDVAIQIGGTERARITSNGLTFNGDTAAANALDDYEEGTWTMGVSFGGASVGAAYVLNTGRYTKIGRQVTASGYLALSAKGSSTGDAAITGLPFTSASTFQAITPAALRLDSVSFTNAFQGYVDGPSTTISLGEVTILGVASNLTNADFTDSSAIMVSVTYTV